MHLLRMRRLTGEETPDSDWEYLSFGRPAEHRQQGYATVEHLVEESRLDDALVVALAMDRERRTTRTRNDTRRITRELGREARTSVDSQPDRIRACTEHTDFATHPRRLSGPGSEGNPTPEPLQTSAGGSLDFRTRMVTDARIPVRIPRHTFRRRRPAPGARGAREGVHKSSDLRRCIGENARNGVLCKLFCVSGKPIPLPAGSRHPVPDAWKKAGVCRGIAAAKMEESARQDHNYQKSKRLGLGSCTTRMYVCHSCQQFGRV